MATIKYMGKEVEVAEDWRLSELIEAENALDLDMETARGAAKMALIIYISMRRQDKTAGKSALALEVMNLDLTVLVMEDDAAATAPLEEGQDSDEPANDSETAEPLTGGHQLSVPSA